MDAQDAELEAWLGHAAFDGQKAICLDSLDFSADCLVYSFGLADDLDFENAMAEKGCRVKGFDPSINQPKQM